jgi:uncharacterized protein
LLGEKKSRDLHPRQPAKRIVDRSNLLRPLALEKLQWFRTDSGTSYRLSKSEAPLSSRKAQPQPKQYAKSGEECQHWINDIHRRPQRGAKCLRRGRMRGNSWQMQRIAKNAFLPRRNPMKKIPLTLVVVLLFADALLAQNPEVKFIADTLVVQADGKFEADPDLATLTFSVFAQDKNLKQTYDQASQSMGKILNVAEKNGLKEEDVTFGVLTVRPFYEGDKKKRAKSYVVQGQMVLKVRDFSKLGPLLEDSVEDGITDFRSLTYSLADEEGAKQKAAAEAMRSAMGRATAVLGQKGQKIGTLRFANLDVKQLVGVSGMNVYSMAEYNGYDTTADSTRGGIWSAKKVAAPPPRPPPQPEKITVSATVQCAFQIQ